MLLLFDVKKAGQEKIWGGWSYTSFMREGKKNKQTCALTAIQLVHIHD
jgi:hypothetical protein